MTRYLSRDPEHLAAMQRKRRERMTRIDYMPSDEARAFIEAARKQRRPGSVQGTNSAVLDYIVTAWAELTGIKYPAKSSSMTSGQRPELTDANARANNFGAGPGIENKAKQRVTCGARRRRDGLPCEAKSVPGQRRCKWHGGCSTGPKTAGGKARALANLRQFNAQPNQRVEG